MADLRLFFAIDLPEGARPSVERAQHTLRSEGLVNARWVHPDALHLTLKFLGNAPEAHVAALAEILERAATGLAPIETSIEAVGAFPTPRKARVVVLALSDPAGTIETLATRLDSACEPLDFAREARRFKPHITLARLKSPRDVSAQLAAVSSFDAALTLSQVRLYRSELTRAGSRYHPVHTVSLSTSLCGARP